MDGMPVTADLRPCSVSVCKQQTREVVLDGLLRIAARWGKLRWYQPLVLLHFCRNVFLSRSHAQFWSVYP